MLRIFSQEESRDFTRDLQRTNRSAVEIELQARPGEAEESRQSGLAAKKKRRALERSPVQCFAHECSVRPRAREVNKNRSSKRYTTDSGTVLRAQRATSRA